MADDTDDLPGSEMAPRGTALTGDGKMLRHAVVALTVLFAVAAVILLAVFIHSLSDVFPHDPAGSSRGKEVTGGSSERTDASSGAIGSEPKFLSGSITSYDYPTAARRAGQEGRVGTKFLVTRKGRVKHCRIVESSGSPALDRASCALLTARFRYSPATNAKGDTVARSKTQSIRWTLAN